MTFSVPPHLLAEKPLETAVYIVPTPIGNLGDISLRALQTLASVDLIACEDTRVTGKLLNYFGIKTKMVPYHDHNADQQGAHLVRKLEQGLSIALASDAGTPLVSDPGYRLVEEVLTAGFDVFPLPGASAPITALSAAGLPSDTFLFAGFLPPKQAARRKRLEALKDIKATLLFFESPKRVAAMLMDSAHVMGDERGAVVARELTKIYETFVRGSLAELADHFQTGDNPKGEIVVLIGPPGDVVWDETAIDARLFDLLQTYRVKEAADILSQQTSLPKRDLYQRALQIKDQAHD